MVSRRHAFRRGFGGHHFGPKWPCRLSLALVPVSSLVLSLRGKLQITRSHEVLIRFPSSWMHSKACIQTNRCTTSYLGYRLRIARNSDFCPEDRKSRYRADSSMRAVLTRLCGQSRLVNPTELTHRCGHCWHAYVDRADSSIRQSCDQVFLN